MLGSPEGLRLLDGFTTKFIYLAHADSTHRNMKSHLKLFTEFCSDLGFRPFPVQVHIILRYITFLSVTGRSFGTIQNHISSVRHFHRLFGFLPGWDNSYSFQLALRGCKRFLGVTPARKHPITPSLLLRMAPLFDANNSLHAAMWALFLVAFFSFLCKSNLVVDNSRVISPKVPRRCDYIISSTGAWLNIQATKTIQFFQRALSIPLPISHYPRLPPLSRFSTKQSFSSKPRSPLGASFFS